MTRLLQPLLIALASALILPACAIEHRDRDDQPDMRLVVTFEGLGCRDARVDTLRITCGWAWTYLVVAELVAANSGPGYAIPKAQRYMHTDKIFAGILLIGLIGLITDQAFRWLHRRAFPWMRK